MHRRRAWLPWAWAALTALLIAGVLTAAWAQARAERARWEAEVQKASLRPQQFFLNWLELRRQLLRSLVLRSRGEGWSDPLRFEMDVNAVRSDVDGEIAMPVVAARVQANANLQQLGHLGVSSADWLALQQRGLPTSLREALQPPLLDGRVPLAQPVGGDQWIWMLLEIPELFQQLHSLDWPGGLSLRLELIDANGKAHRVWQSPSAGKERHRFSVDEPGPAGGWRLHWSASGGPDYRLVLLVAGLGSIGVLALSGGGLLLLLRSERLRHSLTQLKAAHADLRQGLADRSAALEQAAAQHQQHLLSLDASQRRLALAALARRAAQEAPAPAVDALLKRESFSLRQTLESVMSDAAPLLRPTGCLLEYRPGDPVQLDGYPALLSMLLRLCIERAVMRGLAAQPAPELEIAYRLLPGGQVQITLRDNAEPLRDEALAEFFAPPGSGASAWPGGYLLHLLVVDPLGGRVSLVGDEQGMNRLQLELPLVAPVQPAGQT